MADPTLESILASSFTAPWSGRAFRVMLNDFPPNSENTRGARWNPPGTAAIYTCLEPSVCIAEVEYGLSRQSRPISPELRRSIYEIDVSLASVLDIDQALPALAGIGIKLAHLQAEDFQVCQEIGRLATWLGCDGLRVPSARKEGKNLVIYPARAGEAYRFEVLGRRSL